MMALQKALLPFSHIFDHQRVHNLFADHRGATIAAVGLAIIAPLAVRDYLTFLSYGPGGLPYNVVGWLVSNAMRIVSREQLSTQLYDNKCADSPSGTVYLPPDFPPRRKTLRPQFGPHPVPQRQVSQLPDPKIRQQFIAQFEDLGKATKEQGLVDIRPSLYERRHSALFVSKTRDWHHIAQETRGEIAHVHGGLDGSIHVTLHPEDCKKVIEREWGQRHGLSGVQVLRRIVGFSLPVNYILVYAPRDEAEIEIALTIVRASIRFLDDLIWHSQATSQTVGLCGVVRECNRLHNGGWSG
ncbi:hypothetical protein BKA66DRAFT_211869 [Pyrenochaeta sp. MPI-SDFR-AT-0127]|nr:hypothetical protein BKA66DRAFT_211869 [Pyrenochaeta sp. MPI-SDFR-AT-0127]